jgi:hypothetical protein
MMVRLAGQALMAEQAMMAGQGLPAGPAVPAGQCQAECRYVTTPKSAAAE